MPYAVRLQFQFGKGLTTDDKERSFRLAGREVVLKPQLPEETLRATKFYIAAVKGFTREEDAKRFGASMRRALELAGIDAHVGVRTGDDRNTLWLSDELKELVRGDHAGELRCAVFGLVVYDQATDPRWLSVDAVGTVTSDLEVVLAAVERHMRTDSCLPQPLVDAVKLLNAALMAKAEAAMLVLAISAVELLSQGEAWSDAQQSAVKRLSKAAVHDERLTPDEREEVSAAIQRCYKIGVLEANRRLIRRVGLERRLSDWVAVYNQRSRIFHGLAPFDPNDLSALAHEALQLSREIVLAAVDHARAAESH